VTCYIQQSSRRFPSELLIAHNERDKRYFDIYRVDVATGDSALLQLNENLALNNELCPLGFPAQPRSEPFQSR
jgi:hypothetical protein